LVFFNYLSVSDFDVNSAFRKVQGFQRKREDEFARAHVGAPPKKLDGPVTLSEYNPAWPKLFAKERQRIKRALAQNALSIEHVGSTSVPGLAAKPIIDILLVVDDSADEASYVPALASTGYVLRIREPNWHEHRLLKGTNINLHVFSKGDDEIERMLVFRDRLRRNREDMELYLRTKCELARRNWNYTQNYADAKSEVVESIINRARLRKHR
jgi:GrpB-like predicted nucleotidyltransferase (UPF0157 family)